MWWDEGCHSKLTGVIFLVTKSDCSAAYPNLHPSTDTGTAVPVVLYYTSRFSFIQWCCCCGILPRGRIDHPDRARPPGRRQIRAPPPTHALGLAFPPLLKEFPLLEPAGRTDSKIELYQRFSGKEIRSRTCAVDLVEDYGSG